MNTNSKWFRFKKNVTIPKADDATKQHEIPVGTHLVVFDDTVSVAGRPEGSECDVQQINVQTWRICRADLMDFCKRGLVEPVTK
jgi:hypothetical protein